MLVCVCGYVACKDATIEQAVRKADISVVPQAYRAARQKRDGPTHHITIVAKPEMKEYGDDKTAILAKMNAIAKHDFTVVGIGHKRAGGNEAFYLIVIWPSAQEARAELGLPPCHFHITLGFSPSDVHGVSKGIDTLRVTHAAIGDRTDDRARSLLESAQNYLDMSQALGNESAMLRYLEDAISTLSAALLFAQADCASANQELEFRLLLRRAVSRCRMARALGNANGTALLWDAAADAEDAIMLAPHRPQGYLRLAQVLAIQGPLEDCESVLVRGIASTSGCTSGSTSVHAGNGGGGGGSRDASGDGGRDRLCDKEASKLEDALKRVRVRLVSHKQSTEGGRQTETQRSRSQPQLRQVQLRRQLSDEAKKILRGCVRDET